MPIPSYLDRPLLLILAVLAVGACSESDPAAPEDPVPTVAGAWIGSAEDTYGDMQDVNVTLEQNGSDLTGSIQSLIFRTLDSFPLNGTVDPDRNVTLQVLAGDRGGCFDITVNVNLTGSRRSPGTYVIDRKADGCGRTPAGGEPARPFNLSR